MTGTVLAVLGLDEKEFAMQNIFKFGLIALSLLTASAVAFGATSGSITISGAVPGATAITVTSQTGYNNLDLTASPVNLQVASIREVNNTANGYSVSLTSANAGQLKNGASGLAYTAKYNNVSVSLSTTPSVITTGAPSNSVVNVVKPFTISYTGAAADTMLAGTYSDTLTFTISAN